MNNPNPDHPPEPTGDHCNHNIMSTWNGERTMAIWYPQMGGYNGKAVVVGPCEEGCFNVYVWHDGEFPFSQGDEGRGPAFLHHCDPKQFEMFGQIVRLFQQVLEGK